jgi:nucleoside-diphosphate-sugar epimerase
MNTLTTPYLKSASIANPGSFKPSVLVTGGTGFVGYWFDKMKPPDYRLVTLTYEAYQLGEWRNHAWDYIVHLANVSPSAVIECASWHGTRILYASSGAVYHVKKNEYGLNKARWEEEIQSSGINHIITRLFTFTGARLKWGNFAIGNFIRDGIKGDTIRVLGNGETVRSYMYGSDLGVWLWAMLLDSVQGAYDVGSPYAVKMRDLARMIAERCGVDFEIVNQIEYERAPYYLPNINPYLANYLDLHLEVTLEQAIEKSIEDYKHEA